MACSESCLGQCKHGQPASGLRGSGLLNLSMPASWCHHPMGYSKVCWQLESPCWTCAAEDNYTNALRVLARGLESNMSSGDIWRLYLHLYAYRPGRPESPGVLQSHPVQSRCHHISSALADKHRSPCDKCEPAAGQPVRSAACALSYTQHHRSGFSDAALPSKTVWPEPAVISDTVFLFLTRAALQGLQRNLWPWQRQP